MDGEKIYVTQGYYRKGQVYYRILAPPRREEEGPGLTQHITTQKSKHRTETPKEILGLGTDIILGSK